MYILKRRGAGMTHSGSLPPFWKGLLHPVELLHQLEMVLLHSPDDKPQSSTFGSHTVARYKDAKILVLFGAGQTTLPDSGKFDLQRCYVWGML